MAEEKVDWFSWFWRMLGGSVISIVAVLVLTLFNNLNANISSLGISVSANQSELSNLRSEFNTLKDNQERLRLLTTKFQDTNKQDFKDLAKQVQDAREKLATLEERNKQLDEKLKLLEPKVESKKEESR